ncbi:MAG: hypothetical protein WBD20_07795 [Pirellulaceae bacterium]
MNMRIPTSRRCSAVLAITSLAVILLQPPTAHGQIMVSPEIEKAAAAKLEPPPKTEIKIWAAPEPSPALHYRFWPAPALRQPKNPMPYVMRAVLFSKMATQYADARSTFHEPLSDFREMPIDELPQDEVAKFIDKFGKVMLDELGHAENAMDIRYELDLVDLSASEFISTLLPEFQEMRAVARLLDMRARLAAGEGRWNDFSRDCRLGFRFAEVAARSTDLLVGRLIGFAIAGMTFETIQEAMQLPGCPNMYWALAAVPDEQLFETREAVEFDATLVLRLRGPDALPNDPIGPDAARRELKRLSQEASDILIASGSKSEGQMMQMMSGVYIVTMVDQARERLADTDAWKDRIAELSPSEAVLRYVHLEFDELHDNWLKWALLSAGSGESYADEMEREANRQKNSGNVLRSLIMQLIPAVNAATRSGTRSKQHKGMLMTIEALRMHADVQGALPQSLVDLKPVPAPLDSISGQPFRYLRTSETTATLGRAERHSGDKETTFNIRLMTKDAK